MLDFIIANLSTIIVSLILLIIVALIIAVKIKDKKSGKCCSNCKGCGERYICKK
ncbi:MAG: FeoB-associated Cys-rich membrane protein [Clostridia bacterium]|nr:FeoB-associated Cys-rich membrane protein [Clostridia bacterium]